VGVAALTYLQFHFPQFRRNGKMFLTIGYGPVILCCSHGPNSLKLLNPALILGAMASTDPHWLHRYVHLSESCLTTNQTNINSIVAWCYKKFIISVSHGDVHRTRNSLHQINKRHHSHTHTPINNYYTSQRPRVLDGYARDSCFPTVHDWQNLTTQLMASLQQNNNASVSTADNIRRNRTNIDVNNTAPQQLSQSRYANPGMPNLLQVTFEIQVSHWHSPST